MPFHIISNQILIQGDAAGTDIPADNIDQRHYLQSYFHPQDISNLLNQPDVDAVQVTKAIINGTPTLVLIGVKLGGNNNAQIVDRKMAENQNSAGLICPPFTHPGGRHLTDPNANLGEFTN